MQKQKLLKLAKCLRGLTKAQQQHFDMSTFCRDYDNEDCSRDDDGYPDGDNGHKFPLNPQACNTAACALGWATAFFPRSKLKVVEGSVIWEDDTYDYCAGAKMFGITYDQSIYLFSPLEYDESKITPKMVAARIEKLVKKTEKFPS